VGAESRKVCVSCQRLGPETTTEHAIEWRCPDCAPASEAMPRTVRLVERSIRRRIFGAGRARSHVLIVSADRYARSSLARTMIREGYQVRAIEPEDVAKYVPESALGAVVIDGAVDFAATHARVVRRFPGVPLVVRGADPGAPVDLGLHDGPLTVLPADAAPMMVLAALERGLSTEGSSPGEEPRTTYSATAQTERPARPKT
jgi:hypothetical protein